MIMNSNLIFKHTVWEKMKDLYPAQGSSKPKIALFPRLIDVFIVACTIGLQKNQRIENDTNEEISSVNSKTYNDPINDDLKKTLDFLLKILILTMNAPELAFCDTNEKEKLAFSSDYSIEKFNPASILVEYANYGAIELSKLITLQDTETIDNILSYITELKNTETILPDIDEFAQI